jgi:hypothetical protein
MPNGKDKTDRGAAQPDFIPASASPDFIPAEKREPGIVDVPGSVGESMLSGAVGALKEFGGDALTGAGRGLMHTGTALSPLLNKIPYIGETLAPKAGIRAAELMTTPKTPGEKFGYTSEQIGEMLAPTGAEEKGGVLAARVLPKLGRYAAPLGRIAGGALEMGVKNYLQGGEFGTGAALGAGGGIVGEGMRAVAPKVAESALNVTNKMRGRGRTVGEAVLGEIPGIRPATIAASAGEKIGALTNDMESAVHDATLAGARGTTQPAHDVLNDALKKVPRNARELRSKIESLRDVLSLVEKKPGQATKMIYTPDELLEIKRGVDKTIQTWGPEWQKIGDVQRVKQSLYGAIDKELDSLVPGNAELNQRISSLIPAKSAAKKLTTAAPLSQKLAHRMLAHTGALAGSVGGGYAGYRSGGPLGAIVGGTVGLAAPEMLASPSSQMLAARMMKSGVPAKMGAAAATQLTKRKR